MKTEPTVEAAPATPRSTSSLPAPGDDIGMVWSADETTDTSPRRLSLFGQPIAYRDIAIALFVSAILIIDLMAVMAIGKC